MQARMVRCGVLAATSGGECNVILARGGSGPGTPTRVVFKYRNPFTAADVGKQIAVDGVWDRFVIVATAAVEAPSFACIAACPQHHHAMADWLAMPDGEFDPVCAECGNTLHDLCPVCGCPAAPVDGGDTAAAARCKGAGSQRRPGCGWTGKFHPGETHRVLVIETSPPRSGWLEKPCPVGTRIVPVAT